MGGGVGGMKTYYQTYQRRKSQVPGSRKNLYAIDYFKRGKETTTHKTY